jgi:hypothetical protein
MKKGIFNLLIALIFMSGSAFAQSNIPKQMNLVGVARDSITQVPIVNKNIEVRIQISKGKGGSIIYCETQKPRTNDFGEFSIEFGKATGICYPFKPLDSIIWSNGDLYYNIGFDINNSGNYTLIANNKFSTVPYSFSSKTTEKLVMAATKGQILTFDGKNWIAEANQKLSIDTSGKLSLSNGGNSINLPTSFYDEEALDPSAETFITNPVSNKPYSASPNKLYATAPDSGTYLIMGNGQFSGPNGVIFDAFLYLNSITQSNKILYKRYISTSPARSITGSIQHIAYLRKGEQIELQYGISGPAGTYAFNNNYGNNIFLIRLK